jgi:hypothetical protein
LPAASVVVLGATFGGCAAKGPAELPIASGGYDAAFDAARSALTAARFELDRVDARAGVITTQARETGGIATPWDREQTTLSQEIEDAANQQRRRVRVVFEPVSGPAGPEVDLRTTPEPLVARVEVAVDRVRKPGWTLDATAVQYSGRAVSRRLRDRGLYPEYAVPFSQDTELAKRLAARMRETLGIAAPKDPLASTSERGAAPGTRSPDAGYAPGYLPGTAAGTSTPER